jgi:hypothetical protein
MVVVGLGRDEPAHVLTAGQLIGSHGGTEIGA